MRYARRRSTSAVSNPAIDASQSDSEAGNAIGTVVFVLVAAFRRVFRPASRGTRSFRRSRSSAVRRPTRRPRWTVVSIDHTELLEIGFRRRRRGVDLAHVVDVDVHRRRLSVLFGRDPADSHAFADRLGERAHVVEPRPAFDAHRAVVDTCIDAGDLSSGFCQRRNELVGFRGRRRRRSGLGRLRPVFDRLTGQILGPEFELAAVDRKRVTVGFGRQVETSFGRSTPRDSEFVDVGVPVFGIARQ